MDPATIIAGASAVAALVSAVFAVGSSRSSKRSSEMAAQQTQLTYQHMVGRWEPMVSFDVVSVRYRWAKDSTVWDAGGHADPCLGREDRVTRLEAEDRELFVEVLATGRLINHGRRPALLTFYDADPSPYRLPLRNQRLFLVDGADSRQTTLAPGDSLNVTWVDRRSFEEWREHSVAHEERNAWDDDELRPPSLSVLGSVIELCRRLWDPWHSSYQTWRSEVLGRSGFRVVVDSRVADRISEVWDAELGRSPITSTGRDETSQKLLWQLQPDATSPVDDDVVRYRCHQDTTLAQLKRPRMRTVPGRF